jgi:hypothetical protein
MNADQDVSQNSFANKQVFDQDVLKKAAATFLKHKQISRTRHLTPLNKPVVLLRQQVEEFKKKLAQAEKLVDKELPDQRFDELNKKLDKQLLDLHFLESKTVLVYNEELSAEELRAKKSRQLSFDILDLFGECLNLIYENNPVSGLIDLVLSYASIRELWVSFINTKSVQILGKKMNANTLLRLIDKKINEESEQIKKEKKLLNRKNSRNAFIV